MNQLAKLTSVIVIFVLLTYTASYSVFTDKYYILLSDNTCGVARVVPSSVKKQVFTFAHSIEKLLIGQNAGDVTLHIETINADLARYFSNQLCNTSNGEQVGS